MPQVRASLFIHLLTLNTKNLSFSSFFLSSLPSFLLFFLSFSFCLRQALYLRLTSDLLRSQWWSWPSNPPASTSVFIITPSLCSSGIQPRALCILYGYCTFWAISPAQHGFIKGEWRNGLCVPMYVCVCPHMRVHVCVWSRDGPAVSGVVCSSRGPWHPFQVAHKLCASSSGDLMPLVSLSNCTHVHKPTSRCTYLHVIKISLWK